MIGVGAVVWRDGRVLLVKRAKPPCQGQWSLPGGLQEVGETVGEAVRRELAEEAALTIEILGIVDVLDYIERDDEGRVHYHYTLIDMLALAPEGEAVAGGDAAETAWFRPEDLATLALPPGTERVVRKAGEMLRQERPDASQGPGCSARQDSCSSAEVPGR
ncbi:MAG: NUDIX hydrolase [Magnetospirillum sp. WYHS-4]